MTAPHMPMMNDDGLLGCPFCGGIKPHLEKTGNDYFVACEKCGCGTDEWLKPESAINAWNTRNGHLWTKQDFKDAAWERQNSDLLEDKS